MAACGIDSHPDHARNPPPLVALLVGRRALAIPERGVPKDDILRKLREFRGQEAHVDSVRGPRRMAVFSACITPPPTALVFPHPPTQPNPPPWTPGLAHPRARCSPTCTRWPTRSTRT